MSPQATDFIRRVLGRRYRLRGIVDEGGFGRVYRAEDKRLGVDVAVKVIHPWFALDPEWVARFESVARMTAKITHPGVIRVSDAAEDPEVGPYTRL